MSKIEAVLFDLDGTLLDSYPDFLAALETINPNKSEKIIDKSLVRAKYFWWKLSTLRNRFRY